MPGTASGHPAASSACRAMLPDCSPTCWAQPAMTSSIRAGSSPVRVTSASSVPASRSMGCTPASAPPSLPLPEGVRTASTITAVPSSVMLVLLASATRVLGLELRLQQFADLGTRQVGDEAHGPGRLEAGDLRLHERDDLLLELGPRDRIHGGLDECGDRLAHLGVGNADDRDVVDGRVEREHVLGLLRVDVDAAGDNRERLAVGEEQEAVAVEVADVAEGEIGRASCRDRV